MNLNDINSLVGFILRDVKPDLVLTPALFQRLVHSAQVKHYGMLIQEFETTKVVSKELSPFKVVLGDKKPQLSVDTQGYSVLPEDFYIVSSARYQYVRDGVVSWYNIPILSDKEYDDRVGSNLMKPSKTYPIGNVQKDFIRFSPVDLRKVHFTYLSFPVTPVYAVKTNRGFQEYDGANSTVWQWNDLSTLYIIRVMLSEMGINLSPEAISEYRNKENNQQIEKQ